MIINPILFYLIDVVDTLKIIFIILAVGCALGCLMSFIYVFETYDDEDREKGETSLRCILDWLCEEHQILDKEEKEYLSAVIKPFRDEILYIVKHNALVEDIDYQYISIGLSEPNMSFPTFRKGTMYKGMELNKKYTLKELGL